MKLHDTRSALNLKILLLTCVLTFALSACDPDLAVEPGSGDLGSIVQDGRPVVVAAIGNSITAGLQSGAMYASASQFNSPFLLAQQMGMPAADFRYPIFPDPGFGFSRVLLRGFNELGRPILDVGPSLGVISNSGSGIPFHNLGVPGALVADMTDDETFNTRINPYARMIGVEGQSAGATFVEQAASLDPHVLVSIIGSNDVLLFATDGATGSLLPAPTDSNAFRIGIQQLYDRVTELMPDAIVLAGNVPELTSSPFFTTIKWNDLSLTAEQAAALNQVPVYQQLGFAFQEGANGFVAQTGPTPAEIKQLGPNDFVLLTTPQDSLLSAGWGTQTPIPDEFVLDSEEAALVNTMIAAYNRAIDAAVNSHDKIHLLDLRALLKRATESGLRVTGSTPLTTTFISGGLVSLDGIHPTNKGYGILTNEMIKILNEAYGADIPMVAVQDLPAMALNPLP